MSEVFKNFLLRIAVIALVAIYAFSAGRRDALNRLVLPQEPKVDTLFIRDTIMSNDPVYITKTKIDSIPYPVPVTDTLWKTDTIWLQREQVVWQDSLSRVFASGVSVEIDSVMHFLSSQVIIEQRDVIVKVKPKWGIGVHAGYGAFAKNGQISAAPYVGVGVSYNIISW